VPDPVNHVVDPIRRPETGITGLPGDPPAEDTVQHVQLTSG